jgi:hypothetical protein
MLLYHLIRLLIRLVRFLFTHVVGVSILAAVGVLFLLCGGLSFAFTPTEEAATKITAADLESKGPGDKQWLEVTDGYLFWPRAVEAVNVDEKTKKEDPTNFYVPLVSKAVLDRWLVEALAHADDPDKAAYPYDDCRVVLKLSPAELKKAFPGSVLLDGKIPSPPFVQYTAAGRVRPYKDEAVGVREKLEGHTRNLKPDRMLVLEHGASPPTKGAFACMAFFGLPFLIPLGILLIRRRSAKGAEAAAGGPAYADPVAAGVEAGFARHAARRAAPAAAPARAGVNYYYARGGQQFGPAPFEELRRLAAAGRLAPADSVWREGTPNWVPASTVPGLFAR